MRDVSLGEGSVCVVAYAPNCSADNLPCLVSLGGVLEGLPSGDPKDLLGNFSSHMGNDGKTWRGMTELHYLAITKTMFKHKV